MATWLLHLMIFFCGALFISLVFGTVLVVSLKKLDKEMRGTNGRK